MADAQRKSSIHFHFNGVPSNLRERRKFKNLLLSLFTAEKKALRELNYIFCTDKFLLKINRDYLNHDYYTDVISFDLSDSSTEITGEIYISLSRVKQNAENFDQSFPKELLRVMVHGALHLCGYKDETKVQRRQMRRKEEFYLGLFARRST